MEDDFSKLRELKKPLDQTTNTIVGVQPTIGSKPNTRLCFVITKNKNNSWVDDLHAQEQLNRMERVFH